MPFQVKAELERIKSSMIRLKQIQDKSKRSHVDQAAAQRMVTSGLWNPGEAKKHYDQVKDRRQNKRRSEDTPSNVQKTQTKNGAKKSKK